jgi:hypothetical protein
VPSGKRFVLMFIESRADDVPLAASRDDRSVQGEFVSAPMNSLRRNLRDNRNPASGAAFDAHGWGISKEHSHV